MAKKVTVYLKTEQEEDGSPKRIVYSNITRVEATRYRLKLARASEGDVLDMNRDHIEIFYEEDE